MGEKETVPVPESNDEEAETLSYVSDESEEEPAGVCTNRIYINRQELTDIIKMISPNDNPNHIYLHDFEWDDLINCYHYTKKEIDGQDAIRFYQDELRSLIIHHCYNNLTVEMWNDLLKKKLETVTLTYAQFVALEHKITESPYLLSKFRWECMLLSDLYMKEAPNYVGDIPIRFTFFQLATAFLHRTGVDLKWREWRNLVETQDRPLTDSFISASLDFSLPLKLPVRNSGRMYYRFNECTNDGVSTHIGITRDQWILSLMETNYTPSATLFD